MSTDNPNWENLKYIVKHKKDVYLAGRELDAPVGQLLLHDWSKFKPSNWRAYRDYWFGQEGIQNPNGPSQLVYDNFKKAVQRHYETESHHMHKRHSPTNLMDLPLNLRKEVVSDWYALAKHMEDPYQKGPYPRIKTWLKRKGYDQMIKEGSSAQWKKISDKLFRHAQDPVGRERVLKVLEDFLPYAGEDTLVVQKAIKGYKLSKPNNTPSKAQNILKKLV